MSVEKGAKGFQVGAFHPGVCKMRWLSLCEQAPIFITLDPCLYLQCAYIGAARWMVQEFIDQLTNPAHVASPQSC